MVSDLGFGEDSDLEGNLREMNRKQKVATSHVYLWANRGPQ